MEIAPLSVHHSNICVTLFNDILSDSDHRLRVLLPPPHQACKYSLWRTRNFDIPKINTKRARNSFIIESCFNINTVWINFRSLKYTQLKNGWHLNILLSVFKLASQASLKVKYSFDIWTQERGLWGQFECRKKNIKMSAIFALGL